MTSSPQNRSRAKHALQRLYLLEKWKEQKAAVEDKPDRAFIVEFAGMPKAGKSSAIENARHFFSHGHKVDIDGKTSLGKSKQKRGGYRVLTPAEGVSLRTPGLFKKNPFYYNTWAGAYALQELLQARNDDHHDLVILDRGPWDASCWIEFCDSDSDEAKPAIDFFRSRLWMKSADVHFVFVIDPDEAARRESKQRLIGHGGAASNAKLMSEMKSIYENSFPELQTTKANYYSHVGEASAQLLDTTIMAQEDVALAVIEGTLEVIQKKVAWAASKEYDEAWIHQILADSIGRVNKTDLKVLIKPITDKAKDLGSRDSLFALVDRLLDRFLDAGAIVEHRAELGAVEREIRELLEGIE